MSRVPGFSFAPVTEGLQQKEIGNIFIPDLPGVRVVTQSADTNGLLSAAAAQVFLRQPERERGLVVGGDSMRQQSDDGSDSILQGMVRLGVPEDRIVVTASGVDPVTNFIHGQGLFERNLPVGIITPASLWAIHRRVAQRTWYREHGGLLVQGIATEQSRVRSFDLVAAGRVSAGQNPRRPNLRKAENRALRQRRLARAIPLVSGNGFYGS